MNLGFDSGSEDDAKNGLEITDEEASKNTLYPPLDDPYSEMDKVDHAEGNRLHEVAEEDEAFENLEEMKDHSHTSADFLRSAQESLDQLKEKYPKEPLASESLELLTESLGSLERSISAMIPVETQIRQYYRQKEDLTFRLRGLEVELRNQNEFVARLEIEKHELGKSAS